MQSSLLPCSRFSVATTMTLSLLAWIPAHAQESRWAAADEPTAKALIALRAPVGGGSLYS